MNEATGLIAAFAAGAVLGLMFFWGLWLTVDGLGQTRRPALWTLGSLLLRFTLALAGFYLLARYAGWQHLVAAAAGFTLTRILLVHRLSLRQPHTESDP